MSELAKQLYELSIQFEIAEKDGKPAIELAQQIAVLSERIAQAKPAPTQLPFAQVHSHEKAILQPATVTPDADGDILYL